MGNLVLKDQPNCLACFVPFPSNHAYFTSQLVILQTLQMLLRFKNVTVLSTRLNDALVYIKYRLLFKFRERESETVLLNNASLGAFMSQNRKYNLYDSLGGN